VPSWLNSGVPATEVARRLGHSVAVLLKVYANCIDGEEGQVNARIEAALSMDGRRAKLGTSPDGSTVHGEEPAGQSRDGSVTKPVAEDISAGGRAGRVADGGGLENR
jgi:hypothetical protein